MIDSFFKQPIDKKMMISQERSKHYSGYKWPRSTNISPSESIDVKESVRAIVHWCSLFVFRRYIYAISIAK